MNSLRGEDVSAATAAIDISKQLRSTGMVIIDAQWHYSEFKKCLYRTCIDLDMDEIEAIESRLLHNILELQRNQSTDLMKHYVESANLILSDHGVIEYHDVVVLWLSLAMLITSKFIFERLREQSDCWVLTGNVNGQLFISPERGLTSAKLEP